MLVYEYNGKRNEWCRIQEGRIEHLDFTSKLVSGRSIGQNYFLKSENRIQLFRLSKRDQIRCSNVGDSQACVPGQNNNVFHSFEVLDVSSVQTGSNFCQPYCPGECSLIQRGQSELILVKPGMVYRLSQLSHGNSTLAIWHGVLTEEVKPKLLWKKLVFNCDNVEIILPRIAPTCFILKDNLYITGGIDRNGFKNDAFLSCDRYDLVEKQYYNTRHYLPYGMDYYTSTVVTNEEETMVLIHVKEIARSQIRPTIPREGFVVFTEERGFEEAIQSFY
jgi:hypothetical protein